MHARTRLRISALLALALLAPPLQAARDWRAVIADRDRTRLHQWRTAWTEALAQARGAGEGARIAAEGVLLQPDAAIGGAAPDGDYRCRTIKIGARSPGGLAFVPYPAFRCRIARGQFVKLDGSQRPRGQLYPMDDMRMVFLGAMLLGDEGGRLVYGRDADRDMVGVVERIGPRRWRLVLPYPRWESLLDVIELVPAG